MTTFRKIALGYAAAAVLTLIFQIWVRSGYCGDSCGLSYAKAMVWAAIWPASWVVYIAGFIKF